MSPRQLDLDLGPDHAARREHGGGLRAGKRKLARPFDRHRPLHVTMRAAGARVGRRASQSMLCERRPSQIRALIDRAARRHGVRVLEYANVGNHLHFVLRARSRKGFQNFLRAVGSSVALLMTGAKKGQATGKFWAGLAYSKILEWGRMFERAVAYVLGNGAEAEGLARRVRQVSAGRIEIVAPP